MTSDTGGDATTTTHADFNDIIVTEYVGYDGVADGTWRAEAPNGVSAYARTPEDARERCIHMLGIKFGADASMRVYADRWRSEKEALRQRVTKLEGQETASDRPAMPSLVYLASPYSDPDPAVREARFDAVCREAAVMMAAGEYIYSAIAHTHPIAVRGDFPKDWTFWQDFDRAVIGRCAELRVLRLDGWSDSRGVKAEIGIAEGLGVPVTYCDPRPEPLQKMPAFVPASDPVEG